MGFFNVFEGNEVDARRKRGDRIRVVNPVSVPGQFKGRFTITFKDDLYEFNHIYDGGDLIMPIYEDLTIFIKP